MRTTILFLTIFTTSTLQCDLSAIKPVCGADRVTYANSCCCQQARVKVAYKAPCKTKLEPLPAPTYSWTFGAWRWGDHTGKPSYMKKTKAHCMSNSWDLQPHWKRGFLQRFYSLGKNHW